MHQVLLSAGSIAKMRAIRQTLLGRTVFKVDKTQQSADSIRMCHFRDEDHGKKREVEKLCERAG